MISYLVIAFQKNDGFDVHSVREKVSPDSLNGLEWRCFPLVFDLVAEILQISHLRSCVTRHIDQSVESLTRSQCFEYVSMES